MQQLDIFKNRKCMNYFISNSGIRKHDIVYYSFIAILLLIYLFTMFFYISSIYLFFNEEHQNTLFIIGPHVSKFSFIYIGAFFLIQPIVFVSKLYSTRYFYTFYYSALLGFLLNSTSIYMYNFWTSCLILTILLIIVILTVLIQQKAFLENFKNMSRLRATFIVLFSFLNYFSFSEIVFMGQSIDIYW